MLRQKSRHEVANVEVAFATLCKYAPFAALCKYAPFAALCKYAPFAVLCKYVPFVAASSRCAAASTGGSFVAPKSTAATQMSRPIFAGCAKKKKKGRHAATNVRALLQVYAVYASLCPLKTQTIRSRSPRIVAVTTNYNGNPTPSRALQHRAGTGPATAENTSLQTRSLQPHRYDPWKGRRTFGVQVHSQQQIRDRE